MTSEVKPVEEDTATRLSSISAQLDDAQKAVEAAQEAHGSVAGLHLLGEADDAALGAAEQALAEAQRHAAALASAQKVLTARSAEQERVRQQVRVTNLRKESESAARAQDKALEVVAQSSEKLAAALSVVEAQSKVLQALYQTIAAADPQQASEIEQDRRDALALIGTTYAAKRAEVKEVSAAAQYRLQNTSGGDPVLQTDLDLLGHVVVAGTPYSAARAAVLNWQVAALSRLDEEQWEAQQEAHRSHAARAEVGLGAHLPASRDEVQAASNLPDAAIAQLISDRTARDLIGLTAYLPASSNEAIGVRTITRDPLEARQNEAGLQAGIAALRSLAGR